MKRLKLHTRSDTATVNTAWANLWLCLLLLALMAISLPAFAAPIDPALLPTADIPEPLEVLWKERGGRIVIDSVCFNYPKDSADYKSCRKLAAKKFKEECERYTTLYYDSKPFYYDEYKSGKLKYCTASDEIH